MEASIMAHAGTMDLGEGARAKGTGGRWPVVVLVLAVVVGTIAAVWFASSAGLVGGTSVKPAADRAFDAIEAQRGAVTLSTEQSRAIDAHLNAILDRAHAAPYAGDAASLSTEQSRAIDAHLNAILDRAHATPYVDTVVRLPRTSPFGTSHPGKAADQLTPQAPRDRVGGP
jgi:hypothetical protein